MHQIRCCLLSGSEDRLALFAAYWQLQRLEHLNLNRTVRKNASNERVDSRQTVGSRTAEGRKLTVSGGWNLLEAQLDRFFGGIFNDTHLPSNDGC